MLITLRVMTIITRSVMSTIKRTLLPGAKNSAYRCLQVLVAG